MDRGFEGVNGSLCPGMYRFDNSVLLVSSAWHGQVDTCWDGRNKHQQFGGPTSP